MRKQKNWGNLASFKVFGLKTGFSGVTGDARGSLDAAGTTAKDDGSRLDDATSRQKTTLEPQISPISQIGFFFSYQ